MTDALDTHASAIVTDHPFESRKQQVVVSFVIPPRNEWRAGVIGRLAPVALPPNPFLCAVCRLAQAAHLDVTVPYVSDAPRAS